MFSEFMRVSVAVAVACAGAVSVTPAAEAAADGTGGWDRPVVLARRGTSADVAVAGNGDMAVVVTTRSGMGGVRLVRRAGDGDWTSPTTVVHGRHAAFVNAEYDAQDRLWLAWVNNDANPRVLVRHTRAGGGWTRTRVVAARATGDFYGLQLELAAGGRGALAWQWQRGLARPALLIAERAGSADWIPAGRFGRVNDFEFALGDTGLAVVLMGEVLSAESDRVTISRRPVAGSWEAPVELATIPEDVQLVGVGGVTVDPSGTTTVVWRDWAQSTGWQVLAARATESGGWGTPVILGRRAAFFNVPPQVHTSQKGVVLALWNRRDESLMAARYQGGAWTDKVRLSGTNAYEWDAALDPTGRAVAVWMPRGWTGELAPAHSLKARLMTRRGAWGATVDLAPPKTRVLGPLVAMNQGDAVATWWRVITEDPYTFGVSGATHLR